MVNVTYLSDIDHDPWSISRRNEKVETWRNERVEASGEIDGFKWVIGSYDLLTFDFCKKDDSIPNSRVYLAYVETTKTKLNGVVDTDVINNLEIEMHRGCTFTGPATNASILRLAGIENERWFIGEDYADFLYANPTSISLNAKNMVKQIKKHIEKDIIPSLEKALIMVDLRAEDFSK